MAHSKPLDAGTGRVCASFDPGSAAWLSVGSPHPEHGFIELSAGPRFDEQARGDPSLVRLHRLRLGDPAHAALEVLVDGKRPALRFVVGAHAPRWHGDGIKVSTHLEPDACRIGQGWEIAPGMDVEVRLRGRLDRPALAEITETDPPPKSAVVTTARIERGAAVMDAAALSARARITVSNSSVAWSAEGDALIARMGPGSAEFVLTVGLAPSAGRGGDEVRTDRGSGDRLMDRAYAYVRGCTCLRTAPRERTILTDHRLLPLSWTRDAYWQALALLAADGPGDRDRVADHLRWLWRRCDRPEGWWARSHHANGRRKDLAFQADQQLYPILELCEYWRVAETLPEDVDWSRALDSVRAAIAARIDPRTGLLASGENAADDPAGLPFIAASQILRWWTTTRLEELARSGAVDLDPDDLVAEAEAAQAAFDAAFVDGDRAWPYAIDGAGAQQAYHDANDLPVALAPAWGFCSPDDPGWRATMAFAFSAANAGWFEGVRPGLGSAHTPGPWTLGDLQAWIHARLTGASGRAEAALARLHEVAFDDGMLPEAYGASDETRVRQWFAWPGAAYAALRTLDSRHALVAGRGSAGDWLRSISTAADR